MNHTRLYAALLTGGLTIGLAGGLAACSRTGFGDAQDPDSGIYRVDATADVLLDVPTFDIRLDTPPDVLPDVPPDTPDVCGDGVRGPSEACDDGPDNSNTRPNACRTNCQLPGCGDGVVDFEEECDDGNNIDADDCDRQCRGPAEPCLPCGSSNECGRAIDQCARLTDGAFCANACPEAGCEPGLVCETVAVTDAGGLVRLCVPELQVCSGCFDRDEDGYGIGLECFGPDCNDQNPAINPGAVEICNDIDDDCDGNNDEGCPPDLIIDAERVTLAGPQLFDRVEIRNGGVLEVEPPEGGLCLAGSGCLDLEARIIVIAPNSGIDATGGGVCERGAGFEAGSGRGLQNIGPGGGGYGGRGGGGGGRLGGETYGIANDVNVLMGSPGGDFSITDTTSTGDACGDLNGFISEGGNGGGCVRLTAPDIQINGYIRANGEAGEAAPDGRVANIVDGAAGGSGGGIAITATRLSFGTNAQLSAVGGAGGRGGTYTRGVGDQDRCVGNGAGGGGGGRIVVVTPTPVQGTASVRVQGGAGGLGPQSNSTGGQQGTAIVP